jgi:ribulose kinase
MKTQPAQKTSLLNRAISYAKENPVKTAIGAAAVAAAGYGIYKAVTRKKRKKSSKRKKRKSSRRTTRRRSSSRTRRKRGYGTERQYKRKGGLDVKYTKNGQPYVIQSNGRARFVKRSRR